MDMKTDDMETICHEPPQCSYIYHAPRKMQKKPVQQRQSPVLLYCTLTAAALLNIPF